MYFIGEKQNLASLVRPGFYGELDDMGGYCLDAREWVPMGGSFVADLGLDGRVCFGAMAPRGADTWSCPSQRHNRIMKNEHEKKEQSHPKRGGARPGAGRKALDEDGTVVITARLTGKQKAAYDMAGGVQWLRGQLDLFTGEVS